MYKEILFLKPLLYETNSKLGVLQIRSNENNVQEPVR